MSTTFEFDASLVPTEGCITSPLTPTVGPTLTIVRASVGYTPNAAVLCDANTFRNASGGGILIEPGSTNYMKQSEALNTSPWTNYNVTCAVPSVSANTAVAPNGTTTADVLTYPACASTESSTQRVVDFGSFPSPNVLSAYFRSDSPGAALSFIAYEDDGIEWCDHTGVTVGAIGSTWTRATVVSSLAGTYRLGIGYARFAGWCPVTTPAIVAQATSIWGVQSEPWPTNEIYSGASTYIPTVTTSAARSSDNVTITSPADVFKPTGSLTLKFRPRWTSASAGGSTAQLLVVGAPGGALNIRYSNTADAFQAGLTGASNCSLGVHLQTPSESLVYGTQYTVKMRWSPTGTCITGPTTAEVCKAQCILGESAATYAVLGATGAFAYSANATIDYLKVCNTYTGCY